MESNYNNNMGLVSELAQGRELAKQLQIHLVMNGRDSSSQDQAPELLLQRIVASYEKALSMLNYFPVGGESTPPPVGLVGMSESPHGSPGSEDSDQDASSSSRKRKSVPRWSQQVRVSPGMGLEGPLDDGFSWRKYGQKDILGAKYPRGYYRCTQRNVQGCLATKQVQRSDQDPTIFEITYRGRHTCTQATSHLPPPSSSPSPNHPPLINQTLHSQPSDDVLSILRTGLRVQTQDSDTATHSNSFHVATSPAPPPADNGHNGVYFSGSNYFSPTSGLSGNYFGSNEYFRNPESDVITTRHDHQIATAAADSPTVTSDFPFGPVDGLPRNFSFDNSGFFS